MDPHEPFLKAILANRHDDLPRLVYADFLEETGEPHHVARAHFIRTQINLEQTDPKSRLFVEMKAFEARLLDMFLDDCWRFELPEFVRYGSDVEQVKWRRGFPDDLGPMTANDFITFGAAAYWGLPLTSLHLRGRSETFHFDLHPEMEKLSKLTFTHFQQLVSPLDDELFSTVTLASFLFAPVFTSLRHLDLSENGITDRWLVRFLSAFPTSSFAPTLETLDLSKNFGITDAGANVLATAPGLDGLKQLQVRDTGVTKAGMTMLGKRFGSRLR